MATPESPLTQHEGAAGAPPVSAVAEVFGREFTAADVTELRHDLRRHAEGCGLRDDDLDDFVAAVNELVTNAVRHGGGRGRLRLTVNADTLVADVSDRGEGFSGKLPVAAGPPASDTPGGRGILLARLLSDTLLISDGPDGVTVTVTRCLTRPQTAPQQ
jgi:anti-sigma regulatory factor (Ser/Thr protein kinase)